LRTIDRTDIVWTPNKLPELSKQLSIEFDWDQQDAMKIWSFWPDNLGTNILVDMSNNVPHINEIRESVIHGWQRSVDTGVLIEEPMRGFRMNIVDCELMADAIHRGAGQMVPTARRLCYSCQIAAKPNLFEPVYLWKVTVPSQRAN